MQHGSPQDQLDRRRDSKRRPTRDAQRCTDEAGLPTEFPSLLAMEYAIDDQSLDRSMGSLSIGGSPAYDPKGLPESAGLFMESPPASPTAAFATVASRAQQAGHTSSRPLAADGDVEDDRRQRREQVRAQARELVLQSTALGLDVGIDEDDGAKLGAREGGSQYFESTKHRRPDGANARANAQMLEDEDVDNANSILLGMPHLRMDLDRRGRRQAHTSPDLLNSDPVYDSRREQCALEIGRERQQRGEAGQVNDHDYSRSPELRRERERRMHDHVYDEEYGRSCGSSGGPRRHEVGMRVHGTGVPSMMDLELLLHEPPRLSQDVNGKMSSRRRRP